MFIPQSTKWLVHGRGSGSLRATTNSNTHLQSKVNMYVLVCCTETFDVSTFDTSMHIFVSPADPIVVRFTDGGQKYCQFKDGLMMSLLLKSHLILCIFSNNREKSK